MSEKQKEQGNHEFQLLDENFDKQSPPGEGQAEIRRFPGDVCENSDALENYDSDNDDIAQQSPFQIHHLCPIDKNWQNILI